MGRDGSPITLDPGRPYEVSANGAILQDGEPRELAVVQPQSLGDLARAGENLFSRWPRRRPCHPIRGTCSPARWSAPA